MRFGIITGEDFFKTSSQYIARQMAERLIETRHEVFIFNKTNFSAGIPNTQTFKVEGVLNKLFSARLFEQRTLKNQLKQYNVDKIIVFETGNIIKSGIPQIQIINNEPSTEAGSLQKLILTNRMITFSATPQQKLSHLKPELKKKVFISPIPTEEGVRIFSYNEKLSAKEQFAEEKEYFVYTDFEINKERFLNLLKAFSAFKKMQQTNWKLVVCLRSRFTTKELEEIIQPLSNFKFRSDVHIVNTQDDSILAECISGAYAHISTTEKIIYNIPVLEAMLCGVPSLALHSEVTRQYADAVLELSNDSPGAIAEKIMFLYKNESLRNKLSQKAEKLTVGFDREANVNELVSLILK